MTDRASTRYAPVPQQGFEDVDLIVGEPVGFAEILLQDLVDAGDHVADDLRRGVPDTQFLAEFWVEGFEEGLVEVLDGLGLAEPLEEDGPVDPVERVGGPAHHFGDVVPLVEVGGIGQLAEELAEDRHVEVAGGLLPVEPLVRPGGGTVPEDPGAEESVKEGLHERGLEEPFAFLVFHVQAERLFEGLADRFDLPLCLRVLDPLQRITGVAGQEPRDVLGVGKRSGAAEDPLEELDEPLTVLGVGDFRLCSELPERLFGIGQLVVLMTHGLARRVGADQRELSEVGDEHLPVLLPVAGDLLTVLDADDVVLRRLHLDRPAGGEHTLGGLAAAARDLVGGEQAAVGHVAVGVAQAHEAAHPRLFEFVADGVEECFERGVVAELGGNGAGAPA